MDILTGKETYFFFKNGTSTLVVYLKKLLDVIQPFSRFPIPQLLGAAAASGTEIRSYLNKVNGGENYLVALTALTC